MASGYTIEVLNGNVTTVKEFAEVCAKGFGATSHQQEEPLNEPLRPMEKDKAHKKSLNKLKRHLKAFEMLTDKELVQDEKKALNETKEHYEKKLVQVKEAKKKCSDLLRDAQLWTPPTENHDVVKEMMIKELKSTIDFDCNLADVNELIEDINGRLSTIDPKEIRTKQVAALKQQIDYHTESMNVHNAHAEQSNEWVEQLTKSFE